MRPRIIGIILAAGMAVVGCSKKADSGAAATADGQQQATTAQQRVVQQPIAVPAEATPEQVVTVFLNALRSGDSATTESLLTVTARTELPKHQLSVDVQSSPNSSYQVQPAVILPENPNGAHVKSIWTEKSVDGNSEPYEIVWVLRRQPEGWRLAGMAMQLIPGQQAQYLDFENPADMLRKKDEAIATLQAMQAPVAETASTAGQPAQQVPSPPTRIER